MHEILVALVFVSMVASPAIVAAFPLKDVDDDTDFPQETAKIAISSSVSSR